MSLLSGGAYGQYATAHKDHIMRVPPSLAMDAAQLAAIPEVWLTAYQLLKFILQVEENAGKTALLYAAASGVGTALIQLCKMMGVRSIAVSSSKEKLDVCQSLGADFTLNYKELNKDQFVESVMKLTDNKGVDYIVDPVFAQNFEQNTACLAMDSKWVVYGTLGGAELTDVKFSISPLFRKRASLLTTTLRSRSVAYRTELMQSFTTRCLPAFDPSNGCLKAIIDKKFKYTELAKAMEVVETNQAVGKIIVENDLQ